MKQIWYIERKSYEMKGHEVVKQISDAGDEIMIYEKYEDAKENFEIYKKGMSEKYGIVDVEKFPYESFTVEQAIKDFKRVYTLRPLKLKENWYE